MAYQPEHHTAGDGRRLTGNVRRPPQISETAASITTWQWLVFPLVLFACIRLSLFAFSYIALSLTPDLYHEVGPREFMRQYPLVDGLYRWDSEWFYLIARRGYWEARATNFFPLLPLLAWLTNALTGMHVRFALLFVANIASLLAYALVYRIYLSLADEAAARWSLILLMVFPFSFFQAAAYPESLMMLFSALAVWLALRGNHISAGVALGIGVLARHLTMFTGAALLAAQIRERGFQPRRFLADPAIMGLIIPWLFLAGYCLFQYIAFGDPLAFYHARTDPIWGARAWWGLRELLIADVIDTNTRVMYSYIPFALLPTIGAFALAGRQQWITLAAFAIIFMVMLWTIGMWGIGRYAASCWPAFLPLGAWIARRPLWQGPAVAVLALFQGLYFYLFTQQFHIL